MPLIYLRTKVAQLPRLHIEFRNDKRILEIAAREITNYGIGSLEEFDKLITPDFVRAHIQLDRETTEVGFVRSVMMFADLERYFKKSWQHHWQGLASDTFSMLAAQYGKTKVKAVLDQHRIKV
jgi:hypothetical protein